MATQTTSGMTFVAAQVFVSPDNTTWTDVSGHGSSVGQGGGDREVGEVNTFSGEIPIVGAGKLAAKELTVKFVYTETASDPFDVIRQAYEAVGGTLYAQYQVQATGDWYSTGKGIIKTFGYPAGEAKGGEVTMCEFVMVCAQLSKADAST